MKFELRNKQNNNQGKMQKVKPSNSTGKDWKLVSEDSVTNK